MIKKNMGKSVEELLQASKVPLENFSKIIINVVQNGASRQEHKNNLMVIKPNITDYVANKTTTSCTNS